MHVDLDARVLTSDGHEVGRIKHAIIDPRDSEVAAFVVSTGWLLGRDVLIARQEIESARADGDAIRLELSREQFDDLPSFVAQDFSPPPPAYVPSEADSIPESAYLWPTAVPGTSSRAPAPAPGPLPWTDDEAEPPGVERGSRVVDRNGDEVGVVDDLLFDEETGRLRALAITLGGALQRLFGAGRAAKISASLIARVEDEVVYLRTVKEQVDANT
jgi:sporulation protein YlmC with PRC-barrel domain